MISKLLNKSNGKIIDSIKDEFGRIVYEAFKELSIFGVPPLTLSNSGGKDLVNYKIYGESIQETQPTPDTPVEVESVGKYDETTGKYKIPVIASNGEEEIRTEILLNEPLRKFKDYADYIDFENKKVVRPISEKIITGNENSGKHSSGCYVFYLKGYIYSGNTNGGEAGYTNYFTNEGTYGPVLRNEKLGFFFSTSQLRIGYPEKETKDEFIDWVKQKYNEGKPLKVWGILATPTEEEIELPNIPTLKGNCILSVDTNIQPSNAEVIYLGK